ncbi:hypothetical protein ONE63_003569 [Megalurothrips usitatus]|uniref:Uncharacterized protein n=1 Tax=Megalurothrips usitatus TaxID=439358 RepID=A0AAV7X3E6_9NEOP|nr:hypothetical protein ONE63_003569 [Megalurothrips usitatus]
MRQCATVSIRRSCCDVINSVEELQPCGCRHKRLDPGQFGHDADPPELGAGSEFAPNQHSVYPASGFFLRLRALIERTIGVNIPPGTWATRVWNGRHAGELNPVTALCSRFNHPEEVPNFGNGLGVDGMLLLRPIEWGLSAGHVTADFTLELAADNVLGVAGMFTHLGTVQFEKRIKEKHGAPWQWLTHAATSLQTCCRWLAALIGNRQDVTIHEAHNSLAGPGGFVIVAIRVHIQNAPFIEGTGYLPPLMVRTFTHRDMSVCMPALQDPGLLPVMAFILKAKSGPQPTFVPLARAPADQHRQRFAENVPVANSCGRDNYGNAQAGHISRKDQHVAIASSSKNAPQGSTSRQRSKCKGSGRSSSGGSRGAKSPRKKKPRKQPKARSRSKSRGSSGRRKGSRSPGKRSSSRDQRPRSRTPEAQTRRRSQTPGPKARSRSKSPAKRSGRRLISEPVMLMHCGSCIDPKCVHLLAIRPTLYFL